VAKKKKKASLPGRPSLAEEIEAALRLEAEGPDSEAQAEFEAAAAWVTENGGSLPNSVLLALYGCYKQALTGDCHGSSAPWGMEAAMKWKAWKQLEGTPRSEAVRMYVKALRDAVPDWSPNGGAELCGLAKAEPGMNGFGPTVSTMGRIGADDERGNEVDATPVGQLNELIHNGDIASALTVLQQTPGLAFKADKDGMTPLHWAADRGSPEVTRALLALAGDDKELAKSRIDARDHSRETALHYAVNTESEDVAKLLIAAGADAHAENEDGETPYALAEAAGEEWVALFEKT
jgi:acyl-CoA-binding protein